MKSTKGITIVEVLVIMSVIAILVGLLLSAVGCDDNQSPNANYCDNMELVMYHAESMPDWMLDYYMCQNFEVGEYISGISFVWCVSLQSNGVDVGGIRIDTRVDSNVDPLGGDYNIWNDRAPNGEEYGAIHPAGNGGEWLSTDDLASGRTDPTGKLFIFTTYGDPYTGLAGGYDAGYLLPRGNNMISDVTNFSFIVPKRLGSGILAQGHTALFRGQYMDIDGIVPASKQAMGHYMSKSNVDFSVKPVPIPDATTHLQQDFTKDYNHAPYPHAKTQPRDKSGTYSLNDTDWGVYRFINGVGWGEVWCNGDPNLFEITPLWLADANDPNDILDLTRMCKYYLYYANVWVQDVQDVESFYSTAILQSKDPNGQIVDTTPLPMGLWYTWSTDLDLKSMYILPLEDTGVTGLYYDYAGYPIIVVHMVDGGELEVVPDTFYGDWNYDGVVTFTDYNMLLAQMGKDLWSGEGVDLWYDAFPQDGKIDKKDLAAFTRQWLENR